MKPRLAYAAGRRSRNRGKAGFSDLSKVTQPERDRVQVKTALRRCQVEL